MQACDVGDSRPPAALAFFSLASTGLKVSAVQRPPGIALPQAGQGDASRQVAVKTYPIVR